jgi:hypothetical protein
MTVNAGASQTSFAAVRKPSTGPTARSGAPSLTWKPQRSGGREVIEQMATYIGSARNVATTAGGIVPAEETAQMWHVIADLHREHARRRSPTSCWQATQIRSRAVTRPP